MSTNLEDTVRAVIADFMKSDMLFTALDVSNAVKQVLPHAKHREVRDVVRSMFTTDIETQGWARTPIKVTLADGSQAEALLYHPLSDSWDLDNKYDTQRRNLASVKPAAVAQAVVAQAQAQATATIVPVSQQPVVPVAPVSAWTMWDNLFKTQPSLFPKP